VSNTENRCPCGEYSRQRDCPKCKAIKPVDLIEVDRKLTAATQAANVSAAKYKQALKQIETLERSLGVMDALNADASPRKIVAQDRKGTNEASAILVASDWHSEERVNPEAVNFLNNYNTEIATKRIERFWTAGNRLIHLLKQDVKVPTIVLALLGDFITGQIHGAENAETNQLLPVDAIVWAQDRLIEGIDYTLEQHPDSRLIIVCKVGNHGRTTYQNRLNGEENGHSLEFLMYVNLKMLYAARGEKRVEFVIDRSYHTFLDIYDVTVRFHHGHRLKYGGGRGGLFTPTYDAIDNWNKARRANLDVFGHFHQQRDGGSFVCNGSLIGYNGYAQAIKASFEEPKQTLLLIDKKRGRTCLWPVFVEKKR
jgi:hypothetical protein